MLHALKHEIVHKINVLQAGEEAPRLLESDSFGNRIKRLRN